MCRNIRPLFNFAPPATTAEIDAAALQFVRKVSGATRPSRANQAAFDAAVAAVSKATADLLTALETSAPPKDRAIEAARARARSAERFAVVTGPDPENPPPAGQLPAAHADGVASTASISQIA